MREREDADMLEVKNLTFKVNENGIEKSIVKNISFRVEDRSEERRVGKECSYMW